MENWRRRIARERGWYGGIPGPTEERIGVPSKVYTVTQLAPELQEILRDKIEAMVRGPVSLEFHTDSSIIGGMVIQVGSKVLDMSVARELRELGRRVQETIGEHLAQLADTWTSDSDEALGPDPTFLAQLTREAEHRAGIHAGH